MLTYDLSPAAMIKGKRPLQQTTLPAVPGNMRSTAASRLLLRQIKSLGPSLLQYASRVFGTWRWLMKTRLIVAASVLVILSMPLVAQAQGIVRGGERGAAEGGRAAGPVGAAVGGVVGGVTGGVVGGARGVLGVGGYRHRGHYHHHHRYYR